jgi:hypothetical protein
MQQKRKNQYRARRRKELMTKIGIVATGVVVVIGFIIYVLFYAGYFDVRTTIIDAPSSIDEAEIQEFVDQWLNETTLGIKNKSNLILFSPSGVADRIKEAFPRIDSVKIDRQSRHSFVIKIVEREPVGIWCLQQKEQCYYFDVDGIAYLEIPQSSGYLFPQISDERNRTIRLGKKVEDDVWFDSVLLIRPVLQFSGIGMHGISIASNSYDVFKVQTNEDWEIRFNINTNISAQGDALVSFLREKITAEERKALDYVDLTIQDKITYKLK